MFRAPASTWRWGFHETSLVARCRHHRSAADRRTGLPCVGRRNARASPGWVVERNAAGGQPRRLGRMGLVPRWSCRRGGSPGPKPRSDGSILRREPHQTCHPARRDHLVVVRHSRPDRGCSTGLCPCDATRCPLFGELPSLALTDKHSAERSESANCIDLDGRHRRLPLDDRGATRGRRGCLDASRSRQPRADDVRRTDLHRSVPHLPGVGPDRAARDAPGVAPHSPSPTTGSRGRPCPHPSQCSAGPSGRTGCSSFRQIGIDASRHLDRSCHQCRRPRPWRGGWRTAPAPAAADEGCLSIGRGS